MKSLTLLTVAILGACLTAVAPAQDLNSVVEGQEFCRDSGTSVAGLIDGMDVYGPIRGEDSIGETEDLIISSDGKVLALVAEIGGLFDIGDSHVGVPWEMVEFGESWARIPLPDATLSEYELTNEAEVSVVEGGIAVGVDDLDPGEDAWRATNLIGNPVETSDAVGFGLVHDLLLSGDEVEAIIITPNLGLSLFAEYAIPFQSLVEGEWGPGDPVIQLDYDQTEIADIGAFECN